MPNNPIFDEHPIDFGDVHSSEQIIKETWSAFRRALKNKEFSYNEISKALDTTFLSIVIIALSIRWKKYKVIIFLKEVRG